MSCYIYRSGDLCNTEFKCSEIIYASLKYRGARDLTIQKTPSVVENHYTLSNEVANTSYEQEKGLAKTTSQ